ncbi:riboflavin synthase [Hydrogenovibrio marinus]|uniref:Riboflavin synthase n=1 Tax=Hydrogenovibrio marinus TaxID=28885 RepID=A0A066ZNI3_HYDMR|nr:riboflavin synthase [Hydrogenovibrio marinus]KDN95373.1 riboflavin synthase subunit alpha [Hydrogenovibrio marinus]BBN59860.1 riboflavin synthase subunit alpha [Hydrogenovibrio marinus]
MFTGIIESVGSLSKIEQVNGDARFTIDTGKLDMADVKIGDSIACNGVCLTAIELGARHYVADVSAESLSVTTLGELLVGSPVNLEKALRLQDRLGGHLVSGHVDGVGEILTIEQDARSWRYQILAPVALAKYIAAKGSICLNGISLTVNKVEGTNFDINIVPHTRQETTIKDLQIGSKVNLEVDLLARYLERMMTAPQEAEGSRVTKELLAENGFL